MLDPELQDFLTGPSAVLQAPKNPDYARRYEDYSLFLLANRFNGTQLEIWLLFV